METQFISARQLADRWGVSTNTLSNWRAQGKGPRFFKPGGPRGKAVYSRADIEAYEQENAG